MMRWILSLMLVATVGGCCGSGGSCGCAALNVRNHIYDGSSSPCYQPPGPFWNWCPGMRIQRTDPYETDCDKQCHGWPGRRHVDCP